MCSNSSSLDSSVGSVGASDNANTTSSFKKVETQTQKTPKRGPGVAMLEKMLREEQSSTPRSLQSHHSKHLNGNLSFLLDRPQPPKHFVFSAKLSSSSAPEISHEIRPRPPAFSHAHFLRNSDQSQTINPLKRPRNFLLDNSPVLFRQSRSMNSRVATPKNNSDFNSRGLIPEYAYRSAGPSSKNQNQIQSHRFGFLNSKEEEAAEKERIECSHQKTARTCSYQAEDKTFYNFLQIETNEADTTLGVAYQNNNGIDLDLKL